MKNFSSINIFVLYFGRYAAIVCLQLIRSAFRGFGSLQFPKGYENSSWKTFNWVTTQLNTAQRQIGKSYFPFVTGFRVFVLVSAKTMRIEVLCSCSDGRPRYRQFSEQYNLSTPRHCLLQQQQQHCDCLTILSIPFQP